ncbi:zinc finger MYM-type protein 1-like [Daktulosphaira vitifoliae]|uniref:zinc finger MYM-type protein 1-like n=1 Tax=Daktulosphaira vitifoliae TaxID=58002 RepID=UPI0021AACFF2|nr:zinc finger MYM-type protein 1-like [Daktulosphaira vitifoliae]
MKEHENSDDHRYACAKLLARKNASGRVYKGLVIQMEEEIKYWQEILRRVMAVVRSLAVRGLPFRGSQEKFGLRNSGNYIMSLELLAEFDPFLNAHIKRHGNKGCGTTSYLSSKICDEIIDIMAKKVISTIVTEIKQAKYFSIFVDSTPHICHVEQLSFIVRYVSKKECPVERFIRFIPKCGHKAEDIVTIVLDTLKNYDLDIADCRGQSYDNASNMAGAYSDLKARIKEVNALVLFVSCSAHPLNLVGSCAAECCETSISFFSNLQALYNFFSISTHRWGILILRLKQNSKVLKSLSQTRWSARGDACKSLCVSWNEIMAVLKIITCDMSEKPSTRFEASGLLNHFDSLEMCFPTLLWNDVLERFNKVSKSLQSINIELSTIVKLYHSLVIYLEGIRKDSTFDLYELKSIGLNGEQNYAYDLKRKPKRKV